MRYLHRPIAARHLTMTVIGLVVAGMLLGACAPTQMVVTTDPKLSRIRTVYVFPFTSGDEPPDAAVAMTHAFKERLRYDRIFNVVDDPDAADAYFKGTVGKWSRGGLHLDGVRSTVISGRLTLLDASHQHLWSAAAVQRDPWRLVAHGLFSRPPSALAPHWAKAVLQQLPGYVLRERPEANMGGEVQPPRPAS